MNTKISNQIKIASLIAIACTMLGKILGLLREMKIAEALGASASSDAYNVAYLLVITLFGLFSSAYSNSLMPIAAEQYTQDKKRMNKTVNKIVTINYTQDNAVIAGEILKGYALGLPIYVLRDICMYVYYAAKNSKFPSFVTGTSVFINVGLNLLLSYIMGIKGVAYATSLAAIFSLAILALFMKQKVAEVRLMSMRNLGIILISALITWKVASALKKVFATYNVWLNMIAFVCIFAVFWIIALVVELAIKMWKRYLKV